MDVWRRSVKGPDGKTHFLPCSPGEPGAIAATLASLAENGLAEQVCIPYTQNLTQVPVLLGKPVARPAVLASLAEDGTSRCVRPGPWPKLPVSPGKSELLQGLLTNQTLTYCKHRY